MLISSVPSRTASRRRRVRGPVPHHEAQPARNQQRDPWRVAFEWDGVKYIDMGVKADQTTKIVATDTISVACRPAYFIKTGGTS